jgi:hypothetical protein
LEELPVKIYKYTFRSTVTGSIVCDELFPEDGRRDLDSIDMAWLSTADSQLSEFLDSNKEELTEYLPEYFKDRIIKIEVGDYGVVEGKLHLMSHVWANKELTDQEAAEVMDYLTGQFSDGWGESLEQIQWRQDEVRYDRPYFDTQEGEWDEDTEYATAYFHVHPWNAYTFNITIHDMEVEEVDDPQPDVNEELRQAVLKIKGLIDEVVEELKKIT